MSEWNKHLYIFVSYIFIFHVGWKCEQLHWINLEFLPNDFSICISMFIFICFFFFMRITWFSNSRTKNIIRFWVLNNSSVCKEFILLFCQHRRPNSYQGSITPIDHRLSPIGLDQFHVSCYHIQIYFVKNEIFILLTDARPTEMNEKYKFQKYCFLSSKCERLFTYDAWRLN